jgi:hypothetical protein
MSQQKKVFPCKYGCKMNVQWGGQDPTSGRYFTVNAGTDVKHICPNWNKSGSGNNGVSTASINTVPDPVLHPQQQTFKLPESANLETHDSNISVHLIELKLLLQQLSNKLGSIEENTKLIAIYTKKNADAVNTMLEDGKQLTFEKGSSIDDIVNYMPGKDAEQDDDEDKTDIYDEISDTDDKTGMTD